MDRKRSRSPREEVGPDRDLRKSPKNKSLRSSSPVIPEKTEQPEKPVKPEKTEKPEKQEKQKQEKQEKEKEKQEKQEKEKEKLEKEKEKQDAKEDKGKDTKEEKEKDSKEDRKREKRDKDKDRERDRNRDKERKDRRRDDDRGERDRRRERPRSLDRPSGRKYDKKRSKKDADRRADRFDRTDRRADRAQPRWRSSRRDRRRSRSPSLPPPHVAATEEPNAWRKGKRRRHNWREEQRRNEESDIESLSGIPDEEEEDKLLEEARQRREAIKAKYAATDQSPEVEGDGTTPEKADSESESGSETSIGSELQHRLQTDAAGVKDLNRFIREQKEKYADMKEQDKKEVEGEKPEKPEKEGENMFGQFDTQKRTRAEGVNMTGASAHDWDDQDGYYKPQLDEMMEDRYRVFADTCGKGVFSNVAKAKDKKHNVDVAIKVIRNNDMMRKAAEKEIAILRMINHHDRGDKRFVIRLLRTFEYRGHLCMVFECMWDNARTAIKKLGRPGRGVSLNLVHAWTRQLFTALRLLQKCNIIHADLKPDNLLVGGSGKTPVLKVCDLGSAFDVSENEITPYVVSRFYRAPEIILGHRYDCSIDVWAAAVTLYEMYSAKILFKGSTNNDMLKKITEIRGKMPSKLIRGGQFGKNHYNEQHDLLHEDVDPATKKPVTRVVTVNAKPGLLSDMLLEFIPKGRLRSDDPYDDAYVKLVKHFGDFLTRCLSLDYDKRMTPEEALQHPFVKTPFPDTNKLRKKPHR